MTSDLCLHQVVPLCADVFQEAGDVDGTFISHLLQHAVQDDVRTRPADTRTATENGTNKTWEQEVTCLTSRVAESVGTSKHTRFFSQLPCRDVSIA